MMHFPLYQPLGVRTTYRTRDYDDLSEGMGSVGFPQLASPATEGHREVVGALAVERWDDPLQVLLINDNNGSLFPLLRMRDQSVVANDAALYDRDPNFTPEGEGVVSCSNW